MSTAFAVIALVLGIARLGAFVALHLVRSDYHPVRHAVSDYAVGPTRTLSTVGTGLFAAMWAALAGTVATGFPDWPDRVGVTICLAVLAAIFVALPFLPTDLEGEPATAIGRLHLLAAIAWFALSYACMGNFVRLLPAPFTSVLTVLMWIALFALVVLVAALVIRPLRRRAFGLSERAFIVAVNLFYVVVAIAIAV